MGIFGFLNTEPAEDGELEQLRKEQKEMRSYKPQEPDGGPLPGSTPGDSEEYKDYSQRRGEKSDAVFKTADQIIDRYADSAPEAYRNQVKSQVRANPDDAAKIIEKYYESLESADPKGQKIGEPTRLGLRRSSDPYDPEFANLEHHVRSLRVMKRGSEEKALSSGLEAADQTKNLNELQNLKGQLETLTKEIASAQDVMPEAVSKRGEDENQKVLGNKQQQAAAIAEHIKQLEASTKRASDEATKQVNAPPKPEGPTDIKTNLAASGKSDHDYTMAIVGAYRQLEQDYGFDIGDLNKRVAFSVAIRSLLPILDPTGRVTNELVAMSMQMNSPAKKEEKQKASVSGNIGAGAGAKMNAEVEDADTYEIREKQRMRRELFSQLNSAPETQNWLAAISAILLSCVIGSEKAMLYVFGRSSKNGTLSAQLQMLNREISEDMQMLREKKMQDREIRREAVGHLQKERDSQANYERDIEKMYLNHKLILERAKANGSRENQQIVRKLEGDYNRVLRQMSEAEKIMNNNWVEDKDPKKITASREYDQLKREAQFLDQKLRALTEKIAPGTYGDSEEEAP